MACWVRCFPLKQGEDAFTRCLDRYRVHVISQQVIVLLRGQAIRPVIKRWGQTDHYYAELPDEELARVGLEPVAQKGGAA